MLLTNQRVTRDFVCWVVSGKSSNSANKGGGGGGEDATSSLASPPPSTAGTPHGTGGSGGGGTDTPLDVLGGIGVTSASGVELDEHDHHMGGEFPQSPGSPVASAGSPAFASGVMTPEP